MITLPNKPKIIKEERNGAIFEIEACCPGYGITLGNALRRVLLSSLPGAAITGVKIKGVQHEFSTIPHVKEDVVQIILNLKQIRFIVHTDEPIKATLKVKGEKAVKAGDIKTSSDLEVVSKEAPIATLTNKKAELEMEFDIEPGLGYSPVESRKKKKIEIGKIAVDAIFSPVKRVNYSIENMRVGEKTDYDRLTFQIETDGSIMPKEAFLKAADILVNQFKVFAFLGETAKKKKISPKAKELARKTRKAALLAVRSSGEKEKKEDITKKKLNELKISLRTINALEGAGIKTVAGLIRKKEEDLEKIEGLGPKRVVEIRRVLGKMGLMIKSK